MRAGSAPPCSGPYAAPGSFCGSPGTTPGYGGFAPRPTPKLIATFHTHEPAVAVSEGLDRDRAVDESGNQIAVFGRLGSRPFSLEEMQRLYLDNRGDPWFVSDQVR